MKLGKIMKLAALASAGLAAMASAASAEPISISIVTAIGLTSASTFFTAAVAATTFALSSAASFGLNLLATALTGKPEGLKGSVSQVQVGAEVPRQIIFGRGATAGRIVFFRGVGTKNQALHIVYALSDWECDSLEKVWLNGTEKALTSVTPVGSEPLRYTVNDTGGRMLIRFFRGTMAQAADSELVTASGASDGGRIGAWTSNHGLAGMCYASVQLTYDEDDMPAIPQIVFQVKGAKLYDIRKDRTAGGSGAHRWNDPTTWEWSGNPAICAYNFYRGFYRGAFRVLGMGVPSADLINATFTAAANICDETVVEGAANRIRYTCGVIINDDAEFRVAIDAFRTAMAGDVVERAGMFGVIAGAAYSSVMTITDDDMRADASSSYSSKSPRSEKFNGVAVSYLNTALRWDSDSLTPLTNSTYEAEDNGERIIREVDLGMVYEPYQARRIGSIILEQSRMQARSIGVYPAKFSALEPGDWVTRTFNRDGFTSLTMKVINIREVDAEWYEIELQQCAAAAFTPPGGTITQTPAPTITPETQTVAAPGTPSLTVDYFLQGDGGTLTTITATWTASADAASYVLGVKVGAAAEIQMPMGSVLAHAITATTGVLYSIRVRAVDLDGKVSAWSAANTVTPAAETGAPATPTGLAAIGSVESIWLSWAANGESDLAFYEIYELATATPAPVAGTAGTFRISANRIVRDGLGAGVQRWYWIRAVDRSGNRSAWSASVNATSAAATVTTAALAGLIDATSFAAGIRPVEILGALPTSGNFAGRTVFLTTDSKIYRHTGSPAGAGGYTRATDGADIVANSITAGQIAAGAIGATQIAANAIIASKVGITDLSNMIADPNFADAAFWTLGSGWSFGTTQRTALAAVTTLATPTGNGTTSQASSQSELPAAQWVSVETAKQYRIAARARTQLSFTGRLRLVIDWYQLDKTTLISSSEIIIIDRRTATGAATTYTPSQIFTAPALAVWANYNFVVDWSTTLVNAGGAFFAAPTVNRAANGELVVDGSITALKLSVSELSAINANLGTVTAGLIRSGVSGMTLDLDNNRMRSGNYVAGTSGFELDGNTGALKAFSVEVAGGTSNNFPFETAFGTVQDDVLSDEGIANVNLPKTVTNHAWLNVRGVARRTSTAIEYNLQASYNTGSPKFITAAFPRGKGIKFAPASRWLRSDVMSSTVAENNYVFIDSDGKLWALTAYTSSGVGQLYTLIAEFLNEADSDPLFRNSVYAQTKIWVWKHVLFSGIRRIAVPATVTVSGTPTAVTGMRVWMWGAAGQISGQGNAGGPGGYVKFNHEVTPGEILSLLVGGYDGAGFGGLSIPRLTLNNVGLEDLDNQGGGGSFISRGKFTRSNLLGVAGGGGASNTTHGGCGGSATGKGGGNGSTSTELDRCMGVTDKGSDAASTAGTNSGGGGYEGGGINLTGTVGSAGKGGTNFVIGTATSVTNSATGENANGTPTAFIPPGTGEAVYTANSTHTWGRLGVGASSSSRGKAGPGMIAIQWLT